MYRYRLSDEDRERLGITVEWVEFDPANIGMMEAEALEEGGYEVDQFLEDLRGYEVYRDGKPVMVPVVDDDGNQVVTDGEPEFAHKRRFPLRASRAVAWLGSRRSGCTVPLKEFDFSITGAKVEMVFPGKAPEPDPASPS